MNAITMEVVNDTITPWLNSAVRLVEDPRSMLSAIGAALAASTKLRFHEGRGPQGEPWAAVLRGGAPLRDTGVHLMNAVHYAVEGSGGGWAVLVGVPPAWAAVHQYGATIKAKNKPYLKFKVGNRWVQKKEVTVPARPFLGISQSDEDDIRSILQKTFEKGGVGAS